MVKKVTADRVPGLTKSMLLQHCPRCRKGRLFLHPMYARHFMRMYDHCDVCGQRFELEPSFYVGAMYVSYAIEVLLIAVIGLIIYVLWDPDWWVYLSAVLAAILLLIPMLFRVSRSIWIHMFVRYRPTNNQPVTNDQ